MPRGRELYLTGDTALGNTRPTRLLGRALKLDVAQPSYPNDGS